MCRASTNQRKIRHLHPESHVYGRQVGDYNGPSREGRRANPLSCSQARLCGWARSQGPPKKAPARKVPHRFKKARATGSCHHQMLGSRSAESDRPLNPTARCASATCSNRQRGTKTAACRCRPWKLTHPRSREFCSITVSHFFEPHEFLIQCIDASLDRQGIGGRRLTTC
jgi:hypothetical protein